MTHRETKIVGGVGLPSKVASVRGIVKRIIRQIVSAVQARKRTVVIELPNDAAPGHLLVIGAEVSSISGIGQQGKSRRASSGRQADDTCQCIRAIQSTVRFTQYFDLVDADSREVGKLD